MRILFLGRHYTYFRNFESVLRELASRGHALHLAVERSDALGGLQMVQALAAGFPTVTYGEAPVRDPDDDWTWTATQLRLALDYLRYQHPVFARAAKLRERARERTPGLFVRWSDAIPGARWLHHPIAAIVRRIERAIPDEAGIRAYLEAQRPDVVLITPLVDLGSGQIDYLRAARALGIPTAVCVWSWDHLSSKALIREWPDRLFVWNDTQRQEAEVLHGVPRDRIAVTGAQCFDHWFARRPSRDRETFCSALRLPADAPVVMYACSALFSGSASEAEFVVRWIAALRGSSAAALRTCGVLVRPHPARLAEWDGVCLDGLGPVAVWGGNPVDERSRADYFDSLFHSAVVVGINTSAFIEAAIVGRPVHTVLVPELEENQTGTVHFEYLVTVGGGVLRVARGLDEHLNHLAAALADRRPPADASAFVRAFVRPHGLDTPATPLFVQGVEEMASLRAVPEHPGVLPWMWRRLADGTRRTRHAVRLESWAYSAREAESRRHVRELHQRKADTIVRRKVDEELRSAEQRRIRDLRRAEKSARHDAAMRAHEAEKRARRVEKLAAKEARLTEKRTRADRERAPRRSEADL